MSNSVITDHPGYSISMTALRHRRGHILGLDHGTAMLALGTCLLFMAGIAAISRSFTTAVLTTGLVAAGLAVALAILPQQR